MQSEQRAGTQRRMACVCVCLEVLGVNNRWCCRLWRFIDGREKGRQRESVCSCVAHTNTPIPHTHTHTHTLPHSETFWDRMLYYQTQTSVKAPLSAGKKGSILRRRYGGLCDQTGVIVSPSCTKTSVANMLLAKEGLA